MKSGKARGLDGFPVECLIKKGRMAVLEWLVGLLNLSFDMGGTYGVAWFLYSAPVLDELSVTILE